MTEQDKQLMSLVSQSPTAFALAFFGGLPGYLEEGIPDFGKDVYSLIQQNNDKTAIILPRGHLKSTLISKIYVLWLALNHAPIYIRLYSATDSLTQKLSNSHARQLRTNSKLKYYYGDQTQGANWTSHRREFANGSVIEYSSAGSESRGVTSDVGRPKLVLLDDIETTDQAKSPTLTEHLDEWLFKDIYPSLAYDGRIILLGTVISKISLAHRIATEQVKGWECKRLSACNFEDGTVLWPANPKFANINKFEKLRDEAASIGRVADFWSEYLNTPLDDVDQPFTSAMINRTNSLPVGMPLRWFCTMDLAYSKKKGSDKTAWVVMAVDHENIRYVVESGKERLDTQEKLDKVFELYNRYGSRGLRTISIEGNTDFIDHTIPTEQRRRNQMHFSAKLLKHGGVSKADRILELQPALKAVYFLNNNNELIDEMLAWNQTSTVDDLTDALAYASKIAAPADKPAAPNPQAGISAIAKDLIAAQQGKTNRRMQPVKPERG